ncbi:membrane protein insertase YidC [bacterium D16-51]|nr:membrane protein insertase YidC [bacterium D16-59]RKI60397.1 membrane protein insertase YidC [bacterium D16-51]
MDVILTTYQGAFLGPIARLLGKILEAIYYVLSLVGIENVGICIILFTFIVNTLMFPLQIKQQKFSKMSSIMNPELQAIQKKYKNKNDQASQQKMSLETQAVYQKYGVSPASGCLPLLITFPILFALYRVIYNVPAYVNQVYDIYAGVAGSLKDMEVTVEQLSKLVQAQTYVISDAVKAAKEVALAKVDLNYYIDVLGQFNKDAWDELGKKYPTLSAEIDRVSKNASHINSFLGMNIADTPSLKSLSISVPILSVITQIISTKLSMAGMPQQDNTDNPTASSMKMMNNIMPFVSGLMCFMFPIGVGLYWVAGNVFRIFQSLSINLYFNRIDMDEEMQKNMEKSKKRMEKMGIDPKKVQNLNSQKKKVIDNKKEEKKVNAAQVTKNMKKSNYQRQDNTKYEKGSIAAYANMLNRDIPSKEKK